MSVNKDLDLKLKHIIIGEYILGSIYHFKHLNSIHNRFNIWLIPFNREYNKYIKNHLYDLNFLSSSKMIKIDLESNTC